MRLLSIGLMCLGLVSLSPERVFSQENPICFMVDKEDRVRDLSPLCGAVKIPQSTTQVETGRTRFIEGSKGKIYYEVYKDVEGIKCIAWHQDAPDIKIDFTPYIQCDATTDVVNRMITALTEPSGTGKCDYPWQRDSIGRLCGDRAASEREGGR